MSDKYTFTPETEGAIAYYACLAPKFFEAIVKYIDPDKLTDENAAYIVTQCKWLSRQNNIGRPPSSLDAVRQRLFFLHRNDGKLPKEKLTAMYKLLSAQKKLAAASEIISWQELVEQCTPVLKRAAHQDMIVSALEDFQTDAGVGSLRKKINEMESIGSSRETTSFNHTNIVEVIESHIVGESLMYGIPVLDCNEYGLSKGRLGVVMAESGGGKSVFLIHVGSSAVLSGMNVMYISFEINPNEIAARFAGSCMETSYKDIINGVPKARKQAHRFQEAMMAEGSKLGRLSCHYMDPFTVTANQTVDFIREHEKLDQVTYDVVLVDYADKIKSDHFKNSTYQAMEEVYSRLRNMAVEDGKWVWTASQVQRGARKNADVDNLQVDHIADSMHKINSCDIALALNTNAARDYIRFGILKNRTGEVNHATDEVPTRYPFCMITDRQDNLRHLVADDQDFDI